MLRSRPMVGSAIEAAVELAVYISCQNVQEMQTVRKNQARTLSIIESVHIATMAIACHVLRSVSCITASLLVKTHVANER